MSKVAFVQSGEIRRIAFDFRDDLDCDETITQAVCRVSVWAGLDTNAANLLAGGTIIRHFMAEQIVGAADPNGFQPQVSYKVECEITTSMGQVLVKDQIARCISDVAVETPLPSPLQSPPSTILLMLLG